MFGTTVRIKVVLRPKPARQQQRRLNPAQIEALANDYRDGMPVRTIAAKYQVNRDTVNEHVRRMGLPMRYR